MLASVLAAVQSSLMLAPDLRLERHMYWQTFQLDHFQVATYRLQSFWLHVAHRLLAIGSKNHASEAGSTCAIALSTICHKEARQRRAEQELLCHKLAQCVSPSAGAVPHQLCKLQRQDGVVAKGGHSHSACRSIACCSVARQSVR